MKDSQHPVLIRGEGIAASACAHLLQRAGLPVAGQSAARPRLPAIMISETTQRLAADVFGLPDLFQGMHRIRRRVVGWRDGAAPVEVPHSAVVASEDELLGRIRPRVLDPAQDSPAWMVIAARPLPPGANEHAFGSRNAIASAVRLAPQIAPDACWIESLDEGWLFLLPAAECAWLLAVGGSVECMLGRSHLIAPLIDSVSRGARSFPSHPRITHPLCHAGANWIACGTAALGFDPLCGDGSGNALREAILASAVIRFAREGGDAFAAAAHYETRLTAAFMKHLQNCHEFYGSGRSGAWWCEQIESTRTGLEWCRQRLEQSPPSRLRLNGYSLEPI